MRSRFTSAISASRSRSLLPGAHFADEAFTENADLVTEVGRHSDVLVGIVTAPLCGALVRASAR
jgi:hypothetical protein